LFITKGEHMKKYQLIFACCVIIALFLSSPAFAQMKSKEFTGYLSDVACATKMMAADGADLTINPEKNTVGCMKNPGCMSSGFGILIKAKSGKYVFTKFDQKGNDMAKKILEATKRTDNMKIKVMGTKSKGMIKVKSITELE